MGYAMKLICTSIREHRETTTGGEAQIISSWVVPRAISPPETICTSLEEHEAQEQAGAQITDS